MSAAIRAVCGEASYYGRLSGNSVVRYLQLAPSCDSRWTLSIEEHFIDGSSVDEWAYSKCDFLEGARPVPFKVRVSGEVVDYNPTAFGAVVVSKRMAEIIDNVARSDVQWIPAIVDGAGSWEVLNILTCMDCIDHQRSEIQYWPDEDPKRSRKPRGIKRLIINASAAQGHHILRPRDWMVVEVVSEELKRMLEASGITGVEYWPLTRP